jgi:plastocyanin
MRSTANVLLVACIAAMSVTPALAADHTVVMTGDYFGNMFFEPASLNIGVGDRVRWFNNSLVIHTSTSGEECLGDGLWSTGSVNPGATSAFVTFNSLGSYVYYCRFHCEMGMVGEIAVSQIVSTQSATWGRVKALYKATTSRP